MNSPFLRLVWKEYRSQRNLWLALFGFAMCVVLWMSFSLTARDEPFGVMLGISALIGYAFCLCSLLYLFAGEEDNGTASWLRNLPMKTRTLLFAKLTSTAIATVVYLVLSFVSVCVLYGLACLIRGEQLFPESAILRWPNAEEIGDLTKTSAMLVALLCLTLFWSIYSRKVISAICGCAVSMVVFLLLYAAPGDLGESGSRFAIIWWGAGLSMLSIGLSLYVLPGWHRGIRRIDAGGVWHRFKTRQSTTVRQANSGFLARRLQTWATSSPISRRTRRVLLWQELRSVIPFAAACVAFLIPAIWVRYHKTFPATAVLLGFIVLECGLRTFRNDQRRSSGLFWAHRGVSFATVLLTRHAVWLMVVFMLAGVFLLADWLIGSSSPRDTASLIAVFEAIGVPFNKLQRFGDIQPPGIGFRLSIFCLWLLGGYAVGHLCSIWIRKTFVAAFVGIFAFVAYTVFLGVVVINDVSSWLTAWPLTASLLLLPFVTRRYWMDHQSESWKYDLRHILLVAVPVFCMWPMYHVGRLVLPLEIIRLSNLAPNEVLSEQEAAPIKRQPPNINAWKSMWDRLAWNVQATPVSLNLAVLPAGISVRSLEQHKAAILELDEISSLLGLSSNDSKFYRLPEQYQKPWSVSFAEPVASVLIQEARQRRDSGQLGGAIKRLLQAKKLLSYLRTEASDYGLLDATLIWQQVVDQHLHDLVADDRVTVADLRDVEEQLAGLSRELFQAVPTSEYRTRAWIELHSSAAEPKFVSGYALTFRRSGLFERVRYLSIISSASAIEISNTDQWQQLEQLAQRALSTIHDYDMGLYLRSVLEGAKNHSGKYPMIERQWHSAINSQRATQLIVALQLHRL